MVECRGFRANWKSELGSSPPPLIPSYRTKMKCVLMEIKVSKAQIPKYTFNFLLEGRKPVVGL